MNVYDAKHITIPEGAVKQILDHEGIVLWEDEDYGQFYLTNDDTEQVTISVIKEGDAPAISLQTSSDGIHWISLVETTIIISPSYSTTGFVFTIPVNGKIYLRSTSGNAWCNIYGYHHYFSSTGKFGAHGSIMTLLGYNTLKNYDCEMMFYGCANLTTPPTLPATTLATVCYRYMFQDCTGLTTAPTLPATTLADSCYSHMFDGCTGLTTAPALPATTLAISCYSSMFFNCTSLTTAPTLPATTLAEQCYAEMFNNCISLTMAPYLPAPILVEKCYRGMFQYCTNLVEIKCNATDISATDCTKSWVFCFNSGSDYTIPTNGTFYKNANMTLWTTDRNGIPSNWTVRNL